jgi:hypothetical protein
MVQFVGLLGAMGTVLEINQVALDAVGIKLSDVEGKPFWPTFWWQVSEEINATLREAILRAAQGEFVRWDVTRHLEFYLLLLLRSKLDVVVRLSVSTAGRVLRGRREEEGLVAGGEGDVAKVKFFPYVGGGILILSRSYI